MSYTNKVRNQRLNRVMEQMKQNEQSAEELFKPKEVFEDLKDAYVLCEYEDFVKCVCNYANDKAKTKTEQLRYEADTYFKDLQKLQEENKQLKEQFTELYNGKTVPFQDYVKQSERIKELEEGLQSALKKLNHAPCIQRCKDGTTIHGEQCQWCDEIEKE